MEILKKITSSGTASTVESMCPGAAGVGAENPQSYYACQREIALTYCEKAVTQSHMAVALGYELLAKLDAMEEGK